MRIQAGLLVQIPEGQLSPAPSEELPRSHVDFLKPFLKGKILRSSERGVNSILTTILRF